MGVGGIKWINLKASKSVNRREFRISVMVTVIINPLETGLYTLLPYMIQVFIKKHGHIRTNYDWYFAKKRGTLSNIVRTA